MKTTMILVLGLMMATTGNAQKDSNMNKIDTIQVGNFMIIKKNKSGSDNHLKTNDSVHQKLDLNIYFQRTSKEKKNVSTNWWIMDMGFANYRDNSNYNFAQAGTYLKTFRAQEGKPDQNSYQLNTGKSSNFNIWLFMQKRNLYKHAINVKYGLGYEMYNFRFDSRLSMRKDAAPYAYNDSIGFSKNKLFAGYLTVPFMINFNTNPEKNNGVNISLGMSAGYLVSNRNKQISAERGKQKYSGGFNLEPWRVAAIAELGIGPVRLYGSYSINRLQKDITRLEQYPYCVGVRFARRSW